MDMSSCQKTFIKLINQESGYTTEACIDNPIFCLPDNFIYICSTIKTMYKKFCDINIENNIISTRYIFDNIKKLKLFSVFGEEYDPYYFLELKNNKDCTSEADTVIFSFTILFKKIKLVTFVAFYGSIEIENKNTLRCHFKKSEYFKDILASKGRKVLL